VLTPYTGALVALGIFVAGLVYHAGGLAQRLAALEEWRRELREDMRGLNSKLDEALRLIRGGE
jgi:hypothetical protein